MNNSDVTERCRRIGSQAVRPERRRCQWRPELIQQIRDLRRKYPKLGKTKLHVLLRRVRGAQTAFAERVF